MKKIAKIAKTTRNNEIIRPVTNFMGGTSYLYNPMDTLKMVSASSIFGEPQYYRASGLGNGRDAVYEPNDLFEAYACLPVQFGNKTAAEIMTTVIDDALSYDFGATIQWAAELRSGFYMRLNPQVIMVRAAMHPGRIAFTQANPGVFAELQQKVMARADEPATQLSYYVATHGSKSGLPSILKRSWAKKLESCTRYQLAKYKNADASIIDVVRLCHAHSEDLTELMQTGTLQLKSEEKTWENLRSAGMQWKEILETARVGHMALLRNLRGIFTEVDDAAFCKDVMEQLKAGVKGGKQFPFRYFAAYNAVKGCKDVHHLPVILDTLEECMDLACENLPALKGRTMCLSDNSGSAWETVPSEYGTVTVAQIDNLSSVIAARNSDEGFVGTFGNRLITAPVSKRNGVLSQTNALDTRVGGATENGIWLFWEQAIRKKEHWDNVFIFSDMQAGRGDLYGLDSSEYAEFRAGRNIDVPKLVAEYRRTVNPDVNVFSVQTAGYNNAVMPEVGHRTSLLYGWTGKELLYAAKMIDIWDNVKSS